MDELAERGVVAFKAFMCPSGIDDFLWSDEKTLGRGMEIAARHGLLVGVHAEDPKITGDLAAQAIAAGRTGAAEPLPPFEVGVYELAGKAAFGRMRARLSPREVLVYPTAFHDHC